MKVTPFECLMSRHIISSDPKNRSQPGPVSGSTVFLEDVVVLTSLPCLHQKPRRLGDMKTSHLKQTKVAKVEHD